MFENFDTIIRSLEQNVKITKEQEILLKTAKEWRSMSMNANEKIEKEIDRITNLLLTKFNISDNMEVQPSKQELLQSFDSTALFRQFDIGPVKTKAIRKPINNNFTCELKSKVQSIRSQNEFKCLVEELIKEWDADSDVIKNKIIELLEKLFDENVDLNNKYERTLTYTDKVDSAIANLTEKLSLKNVLLNPNLNNKLNELKRTLNISTLLEKLQSHSYDAATKKGLHLLFVAWVDIQRTLGSAMGAFIGDQSTKAFDYHTNSELPVLLVRSTNNLRDAKFVIPANNLTTKLNQNPNTTIQQVLETIRHTLKSVGIYIQDSELNKQDDMVNVSTVLSIVPKTLYNSKSEIRLKYNCYGKPTVIVLLVNGRLTYQLLTNYGTVDLLTTDDSNHTVMLALNSKLDDLMRQGKTQAEAVAHIQQNMFKENYFANGTVKIFAFGLESTPNTYRTQLPTLPSHIQSGKMSSTKEAVNNYKANALARTQTDNSTATKVLEQINQIIDKESALVLSANTNEFTKYKKIIQEQIDKFNNQKEILDREKSNIQIDMIRNNITSFGKLLNKNLVPTNNLEEYKEDNSYITRGVQRGVPRGDQYDRYPVYRGVTRGVTRGNNFSFPSDDDDDYSSYTQVSKHFIIKPTEFEQKIDKILTDGLSTVSSNEQELKEKLASGFVQMNLKLDDITKNLRAPTSIAEVIYGQPVVVDEETFGLKGIYNYVRAQYNKGMLVVLNKSISLTASTYLQSGESELSAGSYELIEKAIMAFADISAGTLVQYEGTYAQNAESATRTLNI